MAIYRHLDVQLSRVKQVRVSPLPRVALTFQFCITSDFCRLLCRTVPPVKTVSSTSNISPEISEVAKTRREMQDWLQMPSIQTSTEIGKNDDESGITQDVDVLLWWRDVGLHITNTRFHSISSSVSIDVHDC